MCSCDLDYWPIFTKIGSRDPEVLLNVCAFFEVHRRFSSWNIRCQNAEFASPLLGNRRCHVNHFVLHSLGVPPHVSFQVWTWYDYPVLSYYNFSLDTLRYVVTLTFDLLTLESCHVMPLWCSNSVPSLNRIRFTFPELGRLQFPIDRQLKVPIFTFFFGVKGVKFQI